MQQQVKEYIYRKQNSPLPPPKDSYQKICSHIDVFIFFYLPFSNKKENYSKVGGGKYFLEDKKHSEMYSMSVSIHHIYSSVTPLSSVVHASALRTQIRTKFVAPAWRGVIFSRGQTGFTPVHIPGRSLCGEQEIKVSKLKFT